MRLTVAPSGVSFWLFPTRSGLKRAAQVYCANLVNRFTIVVSKDLTNLKAKRTVIKQQGAQVGALFVRDEQVQSAPY
jgi:hypothetical protein